MQVVLAADGRSNRKIAEAAGIHPVRFSQKLHGYKGAAFTVEEIHAIARVLGVRPSVLTAQIRQADIVKLAEVRNNEELRVETARATGRWKICAPAVFQVVETVPLDELVRVLSEADIQPQQLREMSAEKMADLWAGYCLRHRRRQRAKKRAPETNE